MSDKPRATKYCKPHLGSNTPLEKTERRPQSRQRSICVCLSHKLSQACMHQAISTQKSTRRDKLSLKYLCKECCLEIKELNHTQTFTLFTRSSATGLYLLRTGIVYADKPIPRASNSHISENLCSPNCSRRILLRLFWIDTTYTVTFSCKHHPGWQTDPRIHFILPEHVFAPSCFQNDPGVGEEKKRETSMHYYFGLLSSFGGILFLLTLQVMTHPNLMEKEL